jgi:hypothetical protein
VCRTHENGVPINFWQCEKPIGAGVLLKTCKGCDAATITAEAGDWARFRHEARVPYCVVVGDVSGSRPNARNLYKSDLHSGPDVLQRHWCVAEHDDGQWNEQFGVERRFRWRQFERRQFGRRSRRPAIDPQRPMRRRFPHRCLGWLQLNGRPTLVRCVTRPRPPALPQLIAIDDCARSPRHVVEDAAWTSLFTPGGGTGSAMYDCRSRSHSPRSPILARAVGRSSRVSPLPPSGTPPASLPRIVQNACETLKPLLLFSKESRPLRLVQSTVQFAVVGAIKGRLARLACC